LLGVAALVVTGKGVARDAEYPRLLLGEHRATKRVSLRERLAPRLGPQIGSDLAICGSPGEEHQQAVRETEVQILKSIIVNQPRPRGRRSAPPAQWHDASEVDRAAVL